jgi:addiction module HigA family antidote
VVFERPEKFFTWRNLKQFTALSRRWTEGSVPYEDSAKKCRKLVMLHGAAELVDLRIPPGNRLEKLHGDREGQHSIRINDQYRVCFVWRDAGAHGVEIVDYHWTRLNGRSVVTPPKKSKAGAWNVHPGEILREEFLKPMDLSVYQLAKELHVPSQRVNEVVLEKRGISADTAVRLARFFGTSEQFWMNLQASYDVRCARAELGKELEKIKPRAIDAA